jgi:hypothetical protein
MIVVVGADRPVLLAEPDDCARFHVAHVNGDLAGGLEAIGGHLGDDGDARVPVAWIRTSSTAPAAALDGMLAYAESQGWLDERGATIRAHVEQT